MGEKGKGKGKGKGGGGFLRSTSDRILDPLPSHLEPSDVKSARDEPLKGTLGKVEVTLGAAHTPVGDLGARRGVQTVNFDSSPERGGGGGEGL